MGRDRKEFIRSNPFPHPNLTPYPMKQTRDFKSPPLKLPFPLINSPQPNAPFGSKTQYNLQIAYYIILLLVVTPCIQGPRILAFILFTVLKI
jgi:hypothetical protein